MSYNVLLSVVIPCDENDGVAALAKKHLDVLGQREADGEREAIWFLQDLAQRTGRNTGPCGGVSLWGMTSNYTLVDVFVNLLGPFWFDLLTTECGGPLDFEHVLVFYENEQSEYANAYEIGFFGPDEPTPRSRDWRALEIRHHEKLPFAWMQM
jgi:hypothetical protein